MAPPLPAPPQSRGLAEESPAPGVTVVQGGRRYLLASRDWAWGVWDQQTRSWVRWFEGERTRDRAWLLWDRLENHGGISFWRRATPLWITLHVILGFVGMGFVIAMLGYALTVGTGHDPESIGTHGVPVAIAWFSAFGGWLVFVYLRKPLGVRVRVLAAATIVGVLAWLLSAA
jgi:hypothetical protein